MLDKLVHLFYFLFIYLFLERLPLGFGRISLITPVKKKEQVQYFCFPFKQENLHVLKEGGNLTFI